MPSVKPFQNMTVEEKAQFFVHVQRLLVAHHPNSEYVFREDNIKERMAQAKSLVKKYQGLCYSDDNICVLYNKIFVTDPNDPVQALKDNMFQPTREDYNAVSIDFVVFRDMKDCLNFARGEYDPKIKYVVYSKGGKPRIYETAKLMSKSFHIPMARN